MTAFLRVLVDVGLDDRVDALVDVDDLAVLVGCERLERGELRGQQRRRHEVPGPAGLTARDDLRAAVQVQELGGGGVVPQLVAVLPLQRRAAHHPAGLGVRRQPLPDRLEPGVPVVVVERLTGGHLGDVGGRVEVVGVGERDPQPLGQGRAHGRLAGAGDAHGDDQRGSVGHLVSWARWDSALRLCRPSQSGSKI